MGPPFQPAVVEFAWTVCLLGRIFFSFNWSQESTLRWRNLAPTAPDTLAVYPYLTQDPFTLTQCPHLYFAANQPKFETALVRYPRHALSHTHRERGKRKGNHLAAAAQAQSAMR